MKSLSVALVWLCCNVSYAQETDTARVSEHTKELDEVVVKASHLAREADHILAIPTKEQRKHAVTGYDLLDNLMVPGVSVDRSTGDITTPMGTATVYIDGREADFREVHSLRPRDISRVEFFEIPTDKYAKDAYSINIILRTPDNGGYTQVDGLRGFGYKNRDHNLISKFVTGTKSVNLWAGYSQTNPKTSFDGHETFTFPDYRLDRIQSYDNADNRRTEEYLQASISNRGKKYTWMLRGGMSWNDKRSGINDVTTTYQKAGEPTGNDRSTDMDSHTRSLRPSVYFYGLHTLSGTKSLDYTVDAYYARNDYNRLYSENDASFQSSVKEDYYYTKGNANYSVSFKHKNKLTASLYEFLRISVSDYAGTAAYRQNLLSSETIFFVDYSQRAGKVFFDINSGLSYLTYRLRGMDAINHLTPRIQTRSSYMIDKKQQVQLTFALGNTYPNINTINNVEQQTDPIIILKGNPNMDNSIILNPRLGYTLNLDKMAFQLGTSYFYQSNAIVSDYYVRSENIISTFRDDCVYHRPGADASVTYKPSNSLNMRLSGLWNCHLVRGGVEHRNQSVLSGSAGINYYAGNFSLSASLATPTRDLVAAQILMKTYWKYQLSAMWSNANWAVEVSANNLFMTRNNVAYDLPTPYYAFSQTDQRRNYNQYATLKVVYSIDYGKKTTKSPVYRHISSESAILK